MNAATIRPQAVGGRGPLIMIEFNELTPSLLFRFMDEGRLPNFRKFYGESEAWITDAEEEGEQLNPWVQWVTIHSGLSAREHGITRLSDGHELKAKAIWDYLCDAGLRVWVCGSMNARYDRPLNGFLLPDPWSVGLRPFPVAEFDGYYDFVREQVLEHSNPARRPSKGAVLKFQRFLATHGLSLGTMKALAGQLLTECRGGGKWRRAALMDRIQWDVFRHYYRKLQPDFATFFANSTAHFQHAYWRHMEPGRFLVQPPAEEVREYGDAILFGYQKMDALMARFMKLAGRDGTLVFCTGLSQQPYLKAEQAGGRHYYRLIGPNVLTEVIGIADRFEYNPVMSDQAKLRFDSEAACARAEELLKSFQLPERSAFWVQRTGASLMVQCGWTKALARDVEMVQDGTGRSVPFFKVFYSMDVLKSGFHHPDGLLWVRRPDRGHVAHERKLSIRAIADIVLDHFGVRGHRGAARPPHSKRFRGAAVSVG